MTELPRRTMLIASAALAVCWVYQGIVPKLIFPDTGETEMLHGAGFSQEIETPLLIFIGLAEVVFGIVILLVRKKIVHILNIMGLLFLATGALIGKPSVYTFPFNPFVISVSMIGLSVICMMHIASKSAE